MQRLKVGLNGFGRIGRSFTRIALKRNSFDIAVINTRKTSNKMLAYLLQYDSIYRKFDLNIKQEIAGISADGKNIESISSLMPPELSQKKRSSKNICADR